MEYLLSIAENKTFVLSTVSLFNTTPALPFLNHTSGWSAGQIQRLATLSALILITLCGNVTIIAVLTCSRKYRALNRRVNIFIINLAAGDLTVCAFTMTSEVLFVVFENGWVLGDLACRLIVYIQIVTLASSTFILTAMSIDRYLIVYKPLTFSPAVGASRASLMILISWVMALLFAIPQVFIFKTVAVGVYVSDGTLKHECASRGYTAWWQRKTYFTLLSLYLLIIPTFIISFCYFKVVRAVWRQGGANAPMMMTSLQGVVSLTGAENRTSGGLSMGLATTAVTQSPRNHSRMGQSLDRGVKVYPNRKPAIGILDKSSGSDSILRVKLQTIKISLSIICCFITCWTPYFVVHLIHIWTEYQYVIPESVYAFADNIALLNSALNPILYACFTVRLKKGLHNVCCLERTTDRKPPKPQQRLLTSRPPRNHRGRRQELHYR